MGTHGFDGLAGNNPADLDELDELYFQFFLSFSNIMHLCPIGAKSTVAWLTAEESAVVCLEFAQTEVKWQCHFTSLKLNPWNMTKDDKTKPSALTKRKQVGLFYWAK